MASTLSPDEQARARHVLRAVESWLRQDVRRQPILDALVRDPEGGSAALAAYLQTVDQQQQAEAPAVLTTTVSDAGYVGTIINAARIYLAHTVQSGPLTALAALPSDVTGFIGRSQELTVLKALLYRTGGSVIPPVISITGPRAGVGKSALAIHLAHRLATRYPYARLYVNLGGTSPAPLAPGEALRIVLHTLGLPGENLPSSAGALEGLYRSRLAGQRALVVLDDASDAAQVRPMLPETPSLALVTTRRELDGLPTARTLHLRALDPADAVDLLSDLGGPERVAKEPEAAHRVARLCDHLPLAVRIAAAALRRKPDWRVVELAGRVATERQRLPARGGDLALRAILAVTLLELAPETVLAFRLLGLLPIPNFTPDIAAILTDMDARTTEGTLHSLVAAQLLEVVSPPDGDRFRHVLPTLAREQGEAAVRAEDSAAALLRLCGRILGPNRLAGEVAEAADAHHAPAAVRPAIA